MKHCRLFFVALVAVFFLGIIACTAPPKIRFEKCGPVTPSYSESYFASDKNSDTQCVISVLKGGKGIDIHAEEIDAGSPIASINIQQVRLIRLSDGTMTVAESASKMESWKKGKDTFSNAKTTSAPADHIFRKYYYQAAISEPLPDWVTELIIDNH